MKAFSRLRRLALRRLARSARRRASLPDADTVLLVLADEFVINDRALRRLLDRDGRDTGDIPGFTELADRQAALVMRIADEPARGASGLIAKARCARLHPAERGFDAAATLGLSLADDLLCLGAPAAVHSSPLSASPPASPLGSRRFRSSVGASPRRAEEQRTSEMSDSRLAALRRNAMVRQTTDALAMIGALAAVALVALPANGVGLTLTGLAALVVTSVTAIGIAFLLLRFIDHSA